MLHPDEYKYIQSRSVHDTECPLFPGERIGYIAMESCVQDYEDLIAGMTASMRYLGYVNAPSLQQKMLLKCVDASVDISIYQETRDILYHALTEIGYTCIHPDGAFYLFATSAGTQ